MTTLLHRVLHAGPDFPFAVLRRHGSDTVDLYTARGLRRGARDR